MRTTIKGQLTRRTKADCNKRSTKFKIHQNKERFNGTEEVVTNDEDTKMLEITNDNPKHSMKHTRELNS